MDGMPSGDGDRDGVLKSLDRAEGVAIRVYAGVLVALVVFVAVLVAGALTDLPVGFGTQGEWFYLGIALALFAIWIVSQFGSISERARRLTEDSATHLETPLIDAQGRILMASSDGDPLASGSPSVHVDATSTTVSWSGGTLSHATEDPLDDEEIARATVLLGVGHDLDQVCRSLNPDYAGWGDERKERYRQYVQTTVSARR